MTLSNEEKLLAQNVIFADDLVEKLVRNLFKSERYNDVDEALKLFFNANTAKTVTESRAHFYSCCLPPLFMCWLIPKYLKSGTVLNWKKEFPSLIAKVNPALALEASEQNYNFEEYIKRESLKGRLIVELVKEVVNTCLQFSSRK